MVDIAKSIAQLNGDDLPLRREAAESLAQMGEEASAAAVALVQACHSDDEILQEWVVAALEQLGPPPQEDLPMFCQQLTADVELPAYWSATLLGRLAERGAAAVDALAQSVNDSAHPTVRQRAVWALGQLGPAARPAEKVLEQAAVCSDPRTARLARQTLEAIQK